MDLGVHNDEKFIVGTKQALKAVLRDTAKEVYIARDADRRLVEPLIETCREKCVTVIEVDTMVELGSICKVQVGTASAARLK